MLREGGRGGQGLGWWLVAASAVMLREGGRGGQGLGWWPRARSRLAAPAATVGQENGNLQDRTESGHVTVAVQ